MRDVCRVRGFQKIFCFLQHVSNATSHQISRNTKSRQEPRSWPIQYNFSVQPHQDSLAPLCIVKTPTRTQVSRCVAMQMCLCLCVSLAVVIITCSNTGISYIYVILELSKLGRAGGFKTSSMPTLQFNYEQSDICGMLSHMKEMKAN